MLAMHLFLVYTGYSCQPSLIYSFDKLCDNIVYDESGRGNNGQLHASVVIGEGEQSISFLILADF